MARFPPLLLLLLIAGAAAQKLRPGPCRATVKPVDDFDLSAFSGLWYENRRLSTIYKVGKKCVTALFSDDLAGPGFDYLPPGPGKAYSDDVGVSFVSVLNSGYVLTKSVRNYGYAYFTNTSSIGSMTLGFPEPSDRKKANYNVIEVEYDSYAVLHSCHNMVGKTAHMEMLWLLTREARFPEQDAKAIVWNLMKRGIYLAFQMERTDQSFCPGRDFTIFTD